MRHRTIRLLITVSLTVIPCTSVVSQYEPPATCLVVVRYAAVSPLRFVSGGKVRPSRPPPSDLILLSPSLFLPSVVAAWLGSHVFACTQASISSLFSPCVFLF